MSEIQLHTVPVEELRPELHEVNPEILNAELRFANSVQQLVEAGVDIDDNRKESLLNAGKELIENFAVREEFFKSEVGSIIFSALANEYADLQNSKDSSFGAKAAHKEFIANSVVFLAGEHSYFSDLYREEKGPVSEKGKQSIYDRYTNYQVSQELLDAMKGEELLGDVRRSMGITTETEQPFEVRVLNIDDERSIGTFGMSPRYPSELSNGELTYGSDEYKQIEDDYLYTSDAFNQYQVDLLEKGKAFSVEMGMEGNFPPAWVTHLDGKTVMCIPLPYAEKILYKEVERPSYYTEDDQSRDLAFLKHEYVHTQKMALADDDPHFGIALEELRAEHFSGDKHGYTDIKRHFRYLQVLNDFNPKMIFDRFGEENPYNPKNFYIELAKQVGLDGVLDYVSAFPRNYIENPDANKLQVEIDEYVGGLSGLQEKEWHRTVLKVGEEEATKRLHNFVIMVSQRMDPENFLPYGLGNTFLVDKMTYIWNKIKPEDYQSPSGF